ncbi:MAG: efflux RND transporter periplasmic adaptor subunit [Ignavibacteriae bacterium]|nr:efflux RND transporter periplasmic adaptor subunit [Ignavibacteriota bacterium]
MKKKKWLWIALGAVVVLGGGFFWLRNGNANKVTYRTAKIDRGNIMVAISATGTLSADTTVQVGSQVSGRIAKLYADFNSNVKTGDLLAQLDPTFLQATLNQAKAGVARARASQNQAQRDYDRTKDLFAKNLVSQADMDAAITNLESAKASLLQVEAQLEGADVNLKYATIRSPISGVVISRNVDVGQTVAASLQAPTLFEIANDLRKMQVKASVDEADIGNVKKGQEVTFRVDAFPNDEFAGRVREIRLAPVIVQNVVTYAVIIDVNNPDMKLMPGMTATISITVATREDVLRAPMQAVKFSPPNADALLDSMRAKRMQQAPDSAGARRWQRERGREGQRPSGRPTRSVLWVLEDGTPQPRMAGSGLQDGRYIELVRTNLNEGDEVIISMTGPQTDAPQATQNPFAPSMPGGGGRRRGF